jgi:preprotein translocase subunit SecE
VATSVEERPNLVRRVGGFFHSAAQYMREVRAEIRKVSWPPWEELRRTTMVVIVFVIIIGIIIGLMDWLASKLLIDLLGRIFR